MKFQKHSLYFLVLNILLLVYACSDVDKSNSVNFFRYNEDAGISTLDPAFVRSQAENWVCSQIYEGLVTLDTDLKIIPCIAKGWNIDSSGKRYTFYLKSNVGFINSDGKTVRNVTASDFIYSFQRLIDPKTASPGAWVLNDKLDFESQTPPLWAANDTTLIINLAKPFAPFLSLLAMPYCYVVNPDIVENGDSEWTQKSGGTGPFFLKNRQDEVRIILHKNTSYHEQDKGVPLPYLQGVVIDLNQNKQSAFMDFIAGKYDFFNGITPLVKDELLTKQGTLKERYQNQFTLHTSPFLNTEFLGFNLKHPPQGMPNKSYKILRKALNLATHREEMITFLRNGMGAPSYMGFVPLGIKAFDSIRAPLFTENISKAQHMMQSLGYHNKNRLPLTLHTTSDYTDIAVLLQNQWKVIYVDLDIQIHPGSYLRQLRNQGNVTLYRGSWIADYPDPENFLACFYSPFAYPNGPNYTQYNNPLADSLYRVASKEQSNSQRMLQLEAMNRIVTEDFPVVFLYYDRSIRLLSKEVQNMSDNAMNSLQLKKVYKKKNSP